MKQPRLMTDDNYVAWKRLERLRANAKARRAGISARHLSKTIRCETDGQALKDHESLIAEQHRIVAECNLLIAAFKAG